MDYKAEIKFNPNAAQTELEALAEVFEALAVQVREAEYAGVLCTTTPNHHVAMVYRAD